MSVRGLTHGSYIITGAGIFAERRISARNAGPSDRRAYAGGEYIGVHLCNPFGVSDSVAVTQT